MLLGGAPQALLLVGPPSVGKTTLALDLAAGLLCVADGASRRPCRACRACRLVASGVHQDLHRLAPEGTGRQIRIGDPHDPDPGSIRHLLRELARLPVEGLHRVAVVEAAHRMNEDAQNALLKTLEEPPAGVTIVLCAEAPEQLLPTIRSRAAILRLGKVGIRAIEELLAAHDVEAPRAARLARLAGGRPGLALALAAAPAAVAAREEIARSLLDLLRADRTARLLAGRDLLARAAELGHLGMVPDDAPARDASAGLAVTASEPSLRQAAAAASGDREAASATAAGDTLAAGPEPATRGTPAERRLAARALLDTWVAVARDLAVAETGARARIRDLALLEDLEAAATRLPPGAAARFLVRVARVTELLEANANPELAVDVLVLAWPMAA